MNRHEQDDLYGAVVGTVLRGGVAVLTGVPRDGIVPPDFYRRLALYLEANDVSVVADLSGAPLKELGGGIGFLKVSHEELARDGFCEDDDFEHVLDGVFALQRSSRARNIIVSRADQPAIASRSGAECSQRLSIRLPSDTEVSGR